MKKVWTKPELFAEEFQLDQHIAKGCGTVVEVVPGESVTGALTCWQTNGNGHWRIESVTIVDTNKNGVIDWEEIRDQATALNGIKTGQGHENHGIALEIPGVERVQVIPENS